MKIISGGQTGVDRGALDAAIALGIPHGGWCPRGRRAEDGRIPDRYEVSETDSPEYAVRTNLVVDLDDPLPPQQIRRWLQARRVGVLNVAGPRESQSPGIAARAREFVEQVLSE